MSRIIYQSPEKNEEYLIDRDAQQLLSHLYMYGSTSLDELSEQLEYENKHEVRNKVNNTLGDNKAGFINMYHGKQIDLNRNPVPRVSLTRDGRRFVNKYEAEISVPLSIHDRVQEMRSIEKDIQEALQRVVHRLEYEDDTDSQDLDDTMRRLEGHFDQIRNQQL